MGRNWIGSTRVVVALCGVVVLLSISFDATARADSVLCEAGTSAGACTTPRGLATDFETGHIYVVDVGNQRIDAFDEGGVSLGSFGVAGSGAGGVDLNTRSSVAVDNNVTGPSPSAHDVFVYDGGNNRIDRFHANGDFVLAFGWDVNRTKLEEGKSQPERNLCTAAFGDTCQAGAAGSSAEQFRSGLSTPKIGVGPGGIVYVVDNIGSGKQRLQKFTDEGELIEPPVELAPSGGLGTAVKGLAVDPSGDFYVAGNGSDGAVRRYDAASALLDTFHFSLNITALALDASGDLFVADLIGVRGVAEYKPTGEERQVIYGEEAHSAEALAVAAEEILSAEGSEAASRVADIPQPTSPGPAVLPEEQPVKRSSQCPRHAGSEAQPRGNFDHLPLPVRGSGNLGSERLRLGDRKRRALPRRRSGSGRSPVQAGEGVGDRGRPVSRNDLPLPRSRRRRRRPRHGGSRRGTFRNARTAGNSCSLVDRGGPRSCAPACRSQPPGNRSHRLYRIPE